MRFTSGLLWGMSVMSQAHGGANALPNKQAVNQAVDSIWKHISTRHGIHLEDVGMCRAVPGCYAGLAEKWRNAPSDEKRSAMDDFPYLGSQYQKPEKEWEAESGDFLVEGNLITVLVEALASSDSEIRGNACRILALKVPEDLIGIHAAAIESALISDPDLSHIARLTGKLPRRIAKRIMASSKSKFNREDAEVDAVLGKLGDSSREKRVIEAYEREKDHRIKEELALLIGYMATPLSIRTLVRDLRTPEFYEWNGRGRRSFRLHVIEALSLAYPNVPLLWKPYYPKDDEYYAKIEDWAVNELGAKWDKPRPPFLWEDRVPIPKPGWKRKPLPGEKGPR